MTEKRKILVVDSDVEFRTAISVILENDDFQVLVARDVLTSMDKVKKEKPDLVILNVTMEAPNRVEHFLKSMESAEDLSTIPILMVSPEEDSSVPRKAIKAIGPSRESRAIRKPQNLIREVENLLRCQNLEKNGERP